MGKVEGLLLIFLIILLLFGAKKIPELAKSIGESMRELKNGMNGEENKKKKDKEKSSE
jgi:sec-independent protein translocase protein TatA